MDIALAALAATGCEKTVALVQQFSQDLSGFRILEDGPQGNVQGEILPLAAIHPFAPAGCAILRDKVGFKTKVKKRGKLAGGLDRDRAPIAAITPVGAAFGNKFFPSETQTPIAAVAGFDKELCFIDKRHRRRQ